jgi:hypothetical protein
MKPTLLTPAQLAAAQKLGRDRAAKSYAEISARVKAKAATLRLKNGSVRLASQKAKAEAAARAEKLAAAAPAKPTNPRIEKIRAASETAKANALKNSSK